MKAENLSNELKIGLQILDLEHPTFSELVKILDGRISGYEISIALDKLNDLGLIKEDWIKRESIWRREIFLTKDSKLLFNNIFDKVKLEQL